MTDSNTPPDIAQMEAELPKIDPAQIEHVMQQIDNAHVERTGRNMPTKKEQDEWLDKVDKTH